jgi:S1-C subfamily serine protease
MKWIALFALLLVGGCSGCASLPDFDEAKASVVRLEFPGGSVCSGTAISRSAFLGAAHCFGAEEGEASVNGKPAKYKVVANDGADHVLVTVDKPFTVWARMSARKPSQGDEVFVHGNPAGIKDMLRVGRVAGWDGDTMAIDLLGWFGDSGAAVFNEDGRIVGVVSRMYPGNQYYWRLVGCYEFKFTAADWKAAGV